MKKTIKSMAAALLGFAAIACSSPEKMAEMAEMLDMLDMAREQLQTKETTLLMSSFGLGLSWGTMKMTDGTTLNSEKTH